MLENTIGTLIRKKRGSIFVILRAQSDSSFVLFMSTCMSREDGEQFESRKSDKTCEMHGKIFQYFTLFTRISYYLRSHYVQFIRQAYVGCEERERNTCPESGTNTEIVGHHLRIFSLRTTHPPLYCSSYFKYVLMKEEGESMTR